MTIHNCQFVNASDVFKGLGDLWEEFSKSDPNFSWGGNNRTLIDGKAILDHLDNSAIKNHRQEEKLRRRIAKLPDDVYVDLEN
ncbi:MAG: hypothetical protein ABSH08_04575 [Tepidisphaeraceae bacterium]